MKGLTFSNSDVIRDVHNSFSRHQIVEFDQKASKQDEDVFHFISYVPINGKVNPRLPEIDLIGWTPTVWEGRDSAFDRSIFFTLVVWAGRTARRSDRALWDSPEQRLATMRSASDRGKNSAVFKGWNSFQFDGCGEGSTTRVPETNRGIPENGWRQTRE